MNLGIDIHAHWLPGVDDGAESYHDGLLLAQGLEQLGFDRLVATPHIMFGVYDNTAQALQKRFQKFQAYAVKNGLSIAMELAAEYYLDEWFIELMQKDRLLTFGDDYVLFEMSFIQPFPQVERVLFDIQNKGYRPVLAHPERYLYYRHKLKYLKRLKELGCFFQMNVLSLSGYYGRRITKFCTKLLQEDLYDFYGSDLHNTGQLKKLNFDFKHTGFINVAVSEEY